MSDEIENIDDDLRDKSAEGADDSLQAASYR